LTSDDGLRFRAADAQHAAAVARLHADSYTAAQAFYRARGGIGVETGIVSPPGGDPARLNGRPMAVRFAWPDPSRLLPTEG